MATTSVLGIGGYDPIMSFVEGSMNGYFSKKSAKRNAKLQYQYAQKYAENSPSWNVTGLRKAGLNPILAATDGAFSSPTVPNIDSSIYPSNSQSSVDASQILQMRKFNKEMEALQSGIDKNNADAEKARSSAVLDGVRSANETVTHGLGGVVGGTAAAYKEGKELFRQGLDAIKQVFDYFNTPSLNKSSPSKPSKTSHEIKSRNAPDDGKGGSSYSPDYVDDLNIPNYGTFKSRRKSDGIRFRKVREGRNPYFYR